MNKYVLVCARERENDKMRRKMPFIPDDNLYLGGIALCDICY